MSLNFKTEKKPSKKSTINDITFCFPIEDTDIFDYQFLQKIEKAMMIFSLFLIYFYWA